MGGCFCNSFLLHKSCWLGNRDNQAAVRLTDINEWKVFICKAWDRNDENNKALVSPKRTFMITYKTTCSSGSEEHGAVEGPCFGPYPGARLALPGAMARWGGYLQRSTMQMRLWTKKPSSFASLPDAFARFPGKSSDLSSEGMRLTCIFL